MDLWVVATAAGAGYLAKYWQKLLKDGNSSSQMSSRNSSNEEVGPLDHPIHQTARRKKVSGDVLADDGEVLNGRSSVMNQFNVNSTLNVASTSGFDCEKLEILGNYQDYNGLSMSNLPLEVSMGKNLQTFGHKSSINGNMDDSTTDQLPCSSSREMNCFQPTVRKIGSLRHKHPYRRFIRPLSSLESCVMSHLYKEHIEMEEYILDSLQSPSKSTLRRFIVNDGTGIVSRAVRDSSSAQVDMDASNFYKEPFIEKNRNAYGVPLLPKIQSLKTSEVINIKAGRRQGGVSSASQMRNENFFHAKDRMILFCLGISIGLISSFTTNKREIDKLKELLKHTENLVQDLQEELEMKDSLTVKELSNENFESQGISENSFYGGKEQNFNPSAKFDNKELFEQNAEEGSESMTKIEAELEAELQRLGLNIDASSADGKFSDLPELDQEFTVYFSEGELRADMISELSATQLQQNQDASEITGSGNHTVSPWELSVRLHEVIQSRLEARVKELETALENSERKLKCTEAKQINSWNEFAQSELPYSSSEESLSAQPLVMNLSGEALDAYNEAYNELINMVDSEEELVHSPSAVDECKLLQSHTTTNGRTNGWTCLSRTLVKEKMKDSHNKIGTMEGHFLLGQQSNDVEDASGDESSDYDDEMEKQLIKQIVEKTRMGSPVVRNAQRWLFAMDKEDG